MRYFLAAAVAVFAVYTADAQTSSIDPFTGEFNYTIDAVTIPGPNGSGYTVKLVYSSDVKMEEEASWVGYGWNLTLPVIQRSRKGLPDDFNGVEVKGVHKVPDRTSFSIQPWYYPEFFKFDLPFIDAALAGGASMNVSYDSEDGFDLSFGAGMAIGHSSGLLAGVSVDDNLNGGFGMGHSFFCGRLGMNIPFTARRTPSLLGSTMMNVWHSSTQYQTTFKWGDVAAGNEIGIRYLYSEMKFGDKTVKGYGYLYSSAAIASKNPAALLDYSLEKGGVPEGMSRPYAAIPYADADTYHVNAPGIGGAFRAYQRLPLEMYAPKSELTSTVGNIAVALSSFPATVSVGVGGTVPLSGAGGMKLINEPLAIGEHPGGSLYAIPYDAKATAELPFLFRYIGDRADAVRYASNNDPIVGSVEQGMGLGSFHERNRDQPIRTNTFVKPVFSTSKVFPRKSEVPAGTIYGFEITDASGNEWKFDERAFVWDDMTMTYVLHNDPTYTRSGLRVAFTPERDPGTYYDEWHGMSIAKPYVDTYMATSITTPDYVDSDGDGQPSISDKGGWTKFIWATQAEEFGTRIPYSGFFVDNGSTDDARDDRRSYSRQTRQLKRISRIETATHRAIFYSAADDMATARPDAWQAMDESRAQTPSWSKTGSNLNSYFTRIVLEQADGSTWKKIRTIHFAYDNSVMPGIMSSVFSTGGKLTLKKVWFEDHDVHDANIDPIKFSYSYPTLASSGATDGTQINVGNVQARYPSVTIPAFSATAQNPTYLEGNVDAWGYYGAKGTSTASGFSLPFDPTPKQDPTTYTAPYLLKRITLPTGAEIVPVYEPRDYGYVQDSSAMELVKLHTSTTSAYSGETLAVDITNVPVAERVAYEQEVRRRFVTNKERLYVRLMYSQKLPKFPTGTTDAASTVRSYVRVTSVVSATVGGVPVLKLALETPTGTAPSGSIRSYLSYSKRLPWSKAVMAFQDAARRNWRPTFMDDKDEKKRLTTAQMATGLLELILGNGAPNSQPGDNLANHPVLLAGGSLIRLPAMRAKLGGGPRVRALYTFSPDGSLQTNDATVTGTLYSYRTFGSDGKARTSGVVTQEPAAMREQMGIVQVDDALLPETRDGQALREVDIARLESPLGESLLPAPTVGHSRVVTASVYGGLTKSPTTVQTFLTTRERPSVRAVPSRRNERKTKFPDILAILADISKEKIEIEQGFSFQVDEGFGAPLSTEVFAGREPATPATPDPVTNIVDDAVLTSGQYFDYVPAGEEVLLLDTITRPLRYGAPGLEMDVVTEHKHLGMERQNLTLEWSVSWTPPFLFIPGAAPRYESHQADVFSYVTSKVTRQPLYLQRRRTFVDGMMDTSRIVAYDARTGAEAVVQGHDTYHGLTLGSMGSPHVGTVTSVGTPALRAYPAMGHRSESEGLVFGPATLDLPDGHVWTGHCTVSVSGPNIRLDLSHITDATNRAKRIAAFARLCSVGDIVEVPAGGANRVNVGGVSTDANGVILKYDNTGGTLPGGSLKIVTSGRRNMVSAPLSTTSVYGADLSVAVAHAGMLRDRERKAETFNDWLRNGWGSVGMLWSRPLVRYSFSGVTPTLLEDLTYTAQGSSPSGLPYIDAQSPAVCQILSLSAYELELSRTAVPGSPPRSYTASIRYMLRQTGYVGITPVCQSIAVSGYGSTLTGLDRWTLFGVNDKGNLVHGNDFVAADERSSALIFNFRSELTNPSHQPNGWDQTNLAGISVPALANLNDVIAATAYRYTRRDAVLGEFRPTYRSEAVYTAHEDATEDVVAGSGGGVWKASGTFDMAGAYVPPASVASPVAPWRLVNRVTKWNDHGLVQEVVGPDDITSSVLFDANGRLPLMQATGAPVAFLWNDNAEGLTGVTTMAHTGAQSASVPYSVAPNLPPLPDAAVEGDRYTVQMWLNYTCPASQVEVTIDAAVFTGATLTAAFVGAVDGWRLYEFNVTGACSTLAVALTGPSPGSAYVDDVVIRPAETAVATAVYDRYERPVAVLDDNAWPTLMHYDARGRHIRTGSESVRGRDIVAESALWTRSNARKASELRGGYSSTPLSFLMMGDGLDDAMEYEKLEPLDVFTVPAQPAGFRMKEPLLDIHLTPEKQRVKTLPILQDIIAPQEGKKK